MFPFIDFMIGSFTLKLLYEPVAIIFLKDVFFNKNCDHIIIKSGAKTKLF